MDITLKIKRISVLTGHGTDRIYLYFDLPTTFPDWPLEECSAVIEATKDYGVAWVKENFHLEPDVVSSCF